MKILQVVGDSKFGGATYLIIEWCKFLAKRRCEVHVLTTDCATISELNKIDSIKVIQSIYIPRNIAPVADLRALLRLSRLIHKERYDVVHTHTSTPGFIGRVAGWIARAPIRFHSAHGWSVTDFSSRKERLFYTCFENLAARISTRVICVSNAAAKQGCRFNLAPRGKLVAVRNGIDPAPFLKPHDGAGQRLRQELRLPPDCLLIGNTSRLFPQKDIESLIRSVRYLRKLLFGKKFVLLLAGDGPEREALEALSKSLRLDYQVHFLGFRRDVPEFLSALDIYASPSLWEGLSISLMEAMAAELPIVTTNIEANAELIEHAITGLLVPVQSPIDLAAAISKLARDPQLANRCARAARARVLEHFTVDRMCQEQWGLYNRFSKAPSLVDHRISNARDSVPL